ncbi:hypothetical protein [Streptomyces scopuliridis]|uniref:Uncharacterized protein n=1 Tax=Streptomyces scopuliridis TaxID=452529 RepID=A0ACD4ZZ03_9ACTN|nr:hypothetical protein [Streptomyces scopuliridis]WSC03460.1 hypothetical protein OG835_41925 [Streptomyces scopuliridis]
MRSALLSSVWTLFADPRLDGASDPVRLTSVLVLAKAPAASSHVITMSRDLAGWLGYGVSHVLHTVVPDVRASGIATCVPARDAAGWTHALDFELLPLKEARGRRGLSPLSLLSRRDLATFLRFCEAVLCPGWAPRDRPATPAGFLALRRGRGSATDRLAMLLLALSARADGRVPMASGRLPKGCNRSEATVAKLLGCSVEDARPVLKRLLALEGVAWDRPERYGEDRLLVPAIRDAYERARAASKAAPEPSAEDASASPAPAAPEEPDAGCARCGDEGECEGLLLAGDGWAQLSFEDVPVEVPGACGVQEPDVEASSQVEAGFDGGSGEAVGAGPHTAHPPVVSLSSSSAGALDCFSGSAVLGEDRLRERAGADENLPGASGALAGAARGTGPLRGEQYSASTGSGWGSPVRTGGFVRPVGVPEDLKVALAPVAWLWAGLERASTGAWLAKTVRLELVRLRSFVGDGEGVAERRLAERLKRRLDRQGTRPVQDLAAWLIRRGLPQNNGCWSNLCDDGIRIDSGGCCPSCDCLIGDRRGLRRIVATEVAAQHPHVAAGERRGVYEEALRAKVEYQSTVDVVRRERAAERQVAFYAAIEEQKAQLAEEEVRRAARPCEDCGRAEAAGLCPVCSLRRSTKALVDQAVDVAVAVRADVDDPQAVAMLTAQVGEDTWAFVRGAVASDGADDPVCRAFAEKDLATKVLEQRRQRALERLRESGPAGMEAAHVRRMTLHGMFPTDKNRERAEKAAAKARERVAQDLLREFLGDLARARAAAVPRERPPAWSERCLDLADRPLDEDTVAVGAGAGRA